MTRGRSERTESLRELLRATAAVTPTGRTHRGWTLGRTAIAAIAAFALAGAGAGVLTAGALVRADDGMTSPMAKTMQIYALHAVEDGHIVGLPKFFRGTGETQFQLGPKPSGPTELVVSFWCLDTEASAMDVDGSSVADDSENFVESKCPASSPSTLALTANQGGDLKPGADYYHTLTVSGTGQFAVWAAWIAQPPTAKPSDQQKAETADGVVSRQEYVDAWSRFQGCMAQAGYPLGAVPSNSLVYAYGVASGPAQYAADFACYPREFQDVDTLWQSEVMTRASVCLQAHESAAPSNAELIQAALEAVGLTPEECGID